MDMSSFVYKENELDTITTFKLEDGYENIEL
jgi:hypothetical protein